MFTTLGVTSVKTYFPFCVVNIFSLEEAKKTEVVVVVNMEEKVIETRFQPRLEISDASDVGSVKRIELH